VTWGDRLDPRWVRKLWTASQGHSRYCNNIPRCQISAHSRHWSVSLYWNTHRVLAIDTAQGSSASRLGQLTTLRVFTISLSSSKQMPVDCLKLGQDNCLQNRLQFAKHFAIWHHTADSVRKSTWLDVTSQANAHSTAECEFESSQKLTSSSMEPSFLANWRYRRFTLCLQEPTAVLKKTVFWASLDFHALLQRYICRRFRKVLVKRLLVSSCLSVCASAWQNSAPFDGALWNSYARILLKYGMKIKFCLKSNKYIGRMAWRPKNFWYCW
jgi:hypothetical protein